MYETCRPQEGGTPKCKLATVKVEIRGEKVSILQGYKDCNDPIDLLIVMEKPDKGDFFNYSLGHADSLEFLHEFLAKAGIDSRRVYLTTLTKCYSYTRPGITEIKACIPHTIHEIETLKPKAIMLLGTAALRLFRLHNKGGIMKIRGTVFNLPLPDSESETTYNVIPSCDPGILFKSSDPRLKASIVHDYITARKVIDGETIESSPESVSFSVIKTISDLKQTVEEIEAESFFAFDTESRGLPWSKEPLICISLAYGTDEKKVIPIYTHDPEGHDWKLKKFWKDTEEVHKLLSRIFENPAIAKAAHNIKYDLNVLRKHLNLRLNGFFYDTMCMHHILMEQKPHDLEYLSDLYFQTGNYSEELHNITGKGKKLLKTYDHIPDEILWPYTALDVWNTFRLCKVFYNQLQEKPHLWRLYCEETEPIIKTLAKAEWYGSLIDLNKHKEITAELTNTKEELLFEFRKHTTPDFNPNSPVMVKDLLCNLGYANKVKDPKKASGYTTDQAKLNELKEEIPLAGDILKFRNISKLLGTYLNVVSSEIEKDNRLRFSWFIHGTDSGRLSCRFLHQIPRVDKKKKNNIKDIFIAQPGYSLLYADYSQIELRLLAFLSKDPILEKIFCFPNPETVDMHSFTAATILGLDVNIDDPDIADILSKKVSAFNRQNCGKNVNFGLAYGSEGHRLVKVGQWEDEEGIRRPITWEMLNEGMTRFKKRHIGLAKYLTDVPEIARKNNGIYHTIFGRERRIGARLSDRNPSIRAAAEREIVNFSIQSPAGAITIRTLNSIDNVLSSFHNNKQIEEGDIFLVNTVHDSMVYEVRDDLIEWFRDEVVIPISQRKIPELSNHMIPCEVGIGKTLTEAESK